MNIIIENKNVLSNSRILFYNTIIYNQIKISLKHFTIFNMAEAHR